MKDFRVLDLPNGFAEHWELLQRTHSFDLNFFNFMSFQKKLLRGQFQVLHHHFSLKRVFLYEGNQLKVAAILHLPRTNTWPAPAGLGSLAMDHHASQITIDIFWQELRDHFPDLRIIAPFHGHHYLGFAAPFAEGTLPVIPEKIGFMTTSANPVLARLLNPTTALPIYRRYHSFEMELNGVLLNRIQEELQEAPSRFTTRPFRLQHIRRDLQIMNDLVNESFTEHYDFCPLSAAENWDIMRWGIPLMKKGTFLFLLDGDREIGFCFGYLDYNQILRGTNDTLNAGRLLTQAKKIQRARVVHIGLKKEYRGQKLVKFLRHRLLLNLHAMGAKVIESSYIDEQNASSRGNVLSTGAKSLHHFALYDVGKVPS